MKVLIVEDEPVTRHLLTKTLENRGHEVSAVGRAEDCVLMLHETPFSIVFLDIGLPGMNGLELGRYIRRQLPDGGQIYIMIGTALVIPDGELTLANILATADDYLPKPFDPDRLALRLEIAEKKVESLQNERGESADVAPPERDNLKTLIEASSSLVMVLDNGQQVITMNQSSSLFLGTDLPAPVRFPYSFSPSEYWPEVDAKLADLRETFRPVAFKTLTRNSKNEEFFILWTASVASNDLKSAHIICSGVDITDQFSAMDRPKDLATRDPLTDLYNGNYITAAYEEVLKKVAAGITCSLLKIDLDRFEEIYNRIGSVNGDKLLVSISNIIRSTVRKSDILLRTGSHFYAFLSNITAHETEQISEQIRVQISDPATIGLEDVSIQPAIGMILIEEAIDFDILISRVDDACYSALCKGKMRAEFYQEPISEIRVQPISFKTIKAQRQGDLSAHADSIRHLVNMGFTAAAIAKTLKETFHIEPSLRDVQRIIIGKNLRPQIGMSRPGSVS